MMGDLPDFNSRTPCGVRLNAKLKSLSEKISTHAPRVGCDFRDKRAAAIPDISTHAPRVGCDSLTRSLIVNTQDFNSRTPCGVRRDILRHLG